MKTTLFLFTLLSFSGVFSQSLTKSEAFEIIPYMSRVEILQLNNKSTFIINDTKKQGINAKIYNEARKVTKEGKLNLTLIPDVGNFSSGIKALFEVNNQAVFFYKRTDKAIHQLIRVIIDPVNGNIIKEEEVAELTGNEYESFFEIAKDPDSDYYAVFKINFKTGIEVLHFSPEHKVLNKINYINPDKDYKFFKPTNYYVHKDEFVLIVSKVLNTDPINMVYMVINPKETLKYYVSKSNKGEKVFINRELSYTSDKNSFIGFEVLYNNKFDLLHLFAYKNTEGKKGQHQELYLNNILPGNSQMIKPTVKIDSSELINYSKIKLARKKEYNAILRDLHVDVAGNVLLLFRHISLAGECKNIGDIGIIKLTAEGKISKSYMFPYNYFECISSMNSSDNAYSSGLFFMSTDKSTYMLLNNIQENMELNDTYEIKSLQKTKAVKYTINDEKCKIDYLEPNVEAGVNAFYYSISNYNETLKTYCTLVNEPKAKKSSFVWIKLD